MVAHDHRLRSAAFPLIGAGSGGFNQDLTKAIMLDDIQKLDVALKKVVVIVKTWLLCTAN